MNIKPLHSRVVVKRAQAKEVSDGGIIIPSVGQEAPRQGEVIAVGPGRRLENGEFNPTVVKVGDVVLYSKSAGTEMKVNNETVFMMFEEDIMGVIS